MADIEALIDALMNGRLEERCSAALELGELGEKRAIEPLIASLKEESEIIRVNAAQALHWIVNSGERIDAFIEKTVESLGNLGDQRAIEALVDGLKDEFFQVRQESAMGLAYVAEVYAVDALIEALKDENEEVRRAASRSLGWFGNNRAIIPLLESLKDENEEVRSSASGALGEMGDNRAILPLIDGLKDESYIVCIDIIDALEMFGISAVGPLIKSLCDNNSVSSAYSAETLGKIGEIEAVEPLIEVLKFSNDDARSSAAEALGLIGDNRAVEPLKFALEDESDSVRRQVALSLKELGHEEKDDITLRNSSNLLWKISFFLLITFFITQIYLMESIPECYTGVDNPMDCADGSFKSNITMIANGGCCLSFLFLIGPINKEGEAFFGKSFDVLFPILFVGALIIGGLGILVDWLSSEEGKDWIALPLSFQCCSILVLFILILSLFSHPTNTSENSAGGGGGGNRKKQCCVKCGASILSNHAGVKATKVAFYTPVTSWIGATVGMAVGGFAGLFAGSLIGGAKGAAKGLEHDLLCSDCKYK